MRTPDGILGTDRPGTNAISRRLADYEATRLLTT